MFVSKDIELNAAPTDAEAGFKWVDVVLSYGNRAAGSAGFYVLPYATAEGYLPNSAFPSAEVFNQVLDTMVYHHLPSDALTYPDVLPIPVAAARQFSGDLILNKMDLSGVDFGFLAHFNSLTGLHVWNTGIGDGELATLPSLPSLQILDVDDNALSTLAPLRNAPALEMLYATGNDIVDLSPLSGLVQLEHLNIGGNQVTDISALSGLTALQGLGIEENAVTDITPLVNLPLLTMLDISDNPIREMPFSAEQMQQMEMMAFSNTLLTNLLFLNHANLNNPDLLIIGTGLSLSGEAVLGAAPQASAPVAQALGLSAGLGRVLAEAVLPQSEQMRYDSHGVLPSTIAFTLAAENGGAVSGTTLAWQGVARDETRGFTFTHWQGNVDDPHNLPESFMGTVTGIYLQGRADVKGTLHDGGSVQDEALQHAGAASPQTGDNGPSPLPFACAGVFGAAVLVLLRRARKQ